MRWWAAGALLLPVLVASPVAGAQMVATVVDQESGAPLPFSTVTLTPTGRPDTTVKFTDGAGHALFVDLGRGQYRLQARELGFRAADTVVDVPDSGATVPVTFRLKRIPHRIGAVYVQAERGCRHPGFPDSAGSGDDVLAMIASQIRENADRARLFAAAYPFLYQRESRYTEQTTKGRSRTIRIDTTTYDSRLHPGYHEGRVVRTVRDGRGQTTRVFLLPTLVDLADPAFQRLHCFWYAGRDSGAAGATIKFDVEPLATLAEPDVAAQFYLDEEHFLVRRATFQLTHPERVTSTLVREAVETHYRELAPLVAVADTVVTTTIIGQPWGRDPSDLSLSEPRTLVENAHLIGVWDAAGAAGDTSAMGTVVDADSATSAVVPAAGAPVTPTNLRGRLIGPGGDPAPGAHLQLVGYSIEVVAGDGGHFEMQGVPPGDQTLLIRGIGYMPVLVRLPANLPARLDPSREVVVHLPASNVFRLNPVVISAQQLAVAYRRIGFDERRQKQRGFFLDADQIAALHATVLHELLGRAPGFQWVRGGPVKGSDIWPAAIPGGSLRVEGDPSCTHAPPATGDHVAGDDASCTVCIDYFVDGRLETFIADGQLASLNKDAQLESRYPPNSIGAIEVYAPGAAPAGLTSGGTPECAAVVLWTKRYLGI